MLPVGLEVDLDPSKKIRPHSYGGYSDPLISDFHALLPKAHDPTPSDADRKATQNLIQAGRILQIGVLDHVVIGRTSRGHSRSWVSLRELGLIF